ncbi:MAG: TadE/TadG family type IV pilus assembly protein [Pseudomonadota bacterium]
MKAFSKLIKRFRQDTRGTVVVTMAISMIPVMGMVAAAVDFSRASSADSELQNALDAAALSVAQQPNLSDQQAASIIKERVLAILDNGHGAGSLTIHVDQDVNDNVIEATASMNIDTAMLAVMGVDYIELGAFSSVAAEYEDLEVALVLDNTGSMSQRMTTLRTAAQDFVDVVMEDGDNENTSIAIVPYVASVNIGNGQMQQNWLDIDGRSRWHADLIETRWLAKYNWCDWPTGGGGADWDNSGSGSDGASLSPSNISPVMDMMGERVALVTDVLKELVGVTPAMAADPYEYTIVDECYIANPDPMSHWQLFDLVDVEWKGCVEARPEPFDVLDVPADPSNPNTLWVPYFWMDDVDDFAWWVPSTSNNWLDDGPFVADTDLATNTWGRAYSAMKYNASNTPVVDEVPPRTTGPNKACGDPILPLTNDYDLLTERVSGMSHWNNGGTQTSQGVVWGWRALSPSAPFTEGVPYGDANKVMVVMTDGVNQLVRSDQSATLSDYSAYGHLRMGRLGTSISSGRDYIDERTLAACTNAKAAGVIVYTVTFGLNSNDARRLWDDCATETSMAYHVNTSNELVGAFNSIAGSVGELRLTR